MVNEKKKENVSVEIVVLRAEMKISVPIILNGKDHFQANRATLLNSRT